VMASPLMALLARLDAFHTQFPVLVAAEPTFSAALQTATDTT
jgi:hypothetical protein